MAPHELLSPETAIRNSFFLVWYLEVVLAIEARGALGNGWIETVEVVCGAYHQDSVVRFQTIAFVEKVATCFVGDETVQVLKDQETRRHHSSMAEYRADRVLGTLACVKRLDI